MNFEKSIQEFISILNNNDIIYHYSLINDFKTSNLPKSGGEKKFFRLLLLRFLQWNELGENSFNLEEFEKLSYTKNGLCSMHFKISKLCNYRILFKVGDHNTLILLCGFLENKKATSKTKSYNKYIEEANKREKELKFDD